MDQNYRLVARPYDMQAPHESKHLGPNVMVITITMLQISTDFQCHNTVLSTGMLQLGRKLTACSTLA